ncbi:hypothetical protein BDD12DRAFT_777466 [Trichophaea hybrida]|nr:hypothetical protein BDD12DRAFT_777466 [Trichophaea hybrida]
MSTEFDNYIPSSSSGAQRRKDKKKDKDKPPSKLVLCFDGTGNKFSGDSSDTNIVKLYQMLDRSAKGQFHYYQPGIGTYSASEGSINAGIFGSIKRWFSQMVDQGIGTTFDHHVMAGYKFVMRYYKPGDLIYIFGFSRGAFTARFLARMITEIGLLSKGNEEMVPFAYRSYQEYEQGSEFKTLEDSRKFMNNFKDTFCRLGVEIHFLGLFDTVNSVGIFEVPFARKKYLPVYAPGADHIRHAVSVDERRLKFKAALFRHDDDSIIENAKDKDVKEVWFPGNHGDIGGGWSTTVEGDVQLSDVALEWMLKEIDQLPEKLAFNHRHAEFLDRVKEKRSTAIETSMCHDALSFHKGWTWSQVLFWWLLEVLPIFKRLELEGGKWVPTYWPPNLGSTRDLPSNAVLHQSVIERINAANGYNPKNLGFIEAYNQNSVENGSG